LTKQTVALHRWWERVHHDEPTGDARRDAGFGDGGALAFGDGGFG
jgi:hypothetical protein